jgi:hypothetical protein
LIHHICSRFVVSLRSGGEHWRHLEGFVIAG